MAGAVSSTYSAQSARDLRLDFFRGLGLIFIFLDHIPNNIVSYFTLGNVSFADAAELFVFISGYSAMLAFGGMIERDGALFAAAQVVKRCWTLYVAHIFLVVIFIAHVSYTAARFDNPMFVDEMGIADFLQEPHIAILKAVTLQFQPDFMDILPLYILLLLAFALLLPLLRAWPGAVIGLSAALYAAAVWKHFNLSTYPEGVWYFNPFAWQMIFLLGALFAVRRGEAARRAFAWPKLIWVTGGFLALCVVARGAVTVLDLLELLPPAAVEFMWTVGDKNNLGPLRLLNFLALAHVTVTVLRRDHPIFASAAAAPVVECGRHSLNVFCLGIFLSVLSHQILVELSGAVTMQIVVSIGGVAAMCGAAYFLSWSKRTRRQAPAERRYIAPPPPGTAPQGGE